MNRRNELGVGYQVYLAEGAEEFGAVRVVERDHLVVYVENAGEFIVRAEAIRSVHDGKVVLEPDRIDDQLRRAIARAHEREEPGR